MTTKITFEDRMSNSNTERINKYKDLQFSYKSKDRAKEVSRGRRT